MAKVLFLELEQESAWALASIGPACIAAYLRQSGHVVSLLRVTLNMPVQQLIGEIRAHAPDLLGVSLSSRQWLRAGEIIPAIRSELDIPVIAGGLHATFASDLVLQTPGFDFVCIGEGEQAMLELMEAIDHGEIPPEGILNIRAKGGPMPRLRPPFEPIDDLPFLARDMLRERFGVVNLMTQRGCPFFGDAAVSDWQGVRLPCGESCRPPGESPHACSAAAGPDSRGHRGIFATGLPS